MNRTLVLAALLLPAVLAHGASAPAAADGDWLAQAQRGIEAAEYVPSAAAGGLQAPNRAQGFRTHFGADGVRLFERTADAAPLVEVRLVAIGRAGSMRAVSPGALRQRDARVEIQRPGLVEWYENRAEGLEQGFTLESRPRGAGPLVLELEVRGASVEAAASGLILRTATRELRYHGLAVRDAANAAHVATMSGDGNRIFLTIAETSARYPLTIDPIFTGGRDGLLESNQAGAYFGFSVAGAGDVNGDGYADVVIGASAYDGLFFTDSGAAFLYLGGPGQLDANFDARLEVGGPNARTGASVAGAGDVNGDGYDDLIVGSPYTGAGGPAGYASLFFGGPGAFDTNSDATLSPNQDGDNFGVSVAGAGDLNGDGYADLVVGANLTDVVSAGANDGAAFVYFGGAGAFDTTSDATLTSSPLGAKQANSGFGLNVAGAGDVNGDGYGDVVVGAYLYDLPSTDEGAAFVYFGGPGAFDPGSDALLEVNQPGAWFGISVAGAGDVNGDGYGDVIVGASLFETLPALTDEGIAVIYFGGAGAFDTSPDQVLNEGQAGAGFGVSVAGAGDVNGDGYADVIVGAQGYDGLVADTGSAFIYLGGAGTFDNTRDWQLISEQGISRYGFSIAGAGDINGDGYADLLVGARLGDNGQTDEGYVMAYYGSPALVNLASDRQLEPNQASAEFGSAVAGAGDVNGDGYGDVIVGARSYDSGAADSGSLFLFLGGPGTLDDTFDQRVDFPGASARYGSSVSGAGDVNGDGYADVVAGAPTFDSDDDALGDGAVDVLTGGPGPVFLTLSRRITQPTAQVQFGRSVAGAGDVNGDGYGDVVVGAFNFANVFFGGPGAFDPDSDARLESDQANANMGRSVAGAGDVNGDGYADVVVGAPNYKAAGLDAAGMAYIYFGGAGAFNTVADGMLPGTEPLASAGVSVAGAGDVNGDGYSDVVVGVPYLAFQNNSYAGGVRLYYGKAGAFDPNPDDLFQLLATDSNSGFGTSVAAAGDFNGDGYADVLAGAPGNTANLAEQGIVALMPGSPTGFDNAQLLRVQQASANLGTSVAGAGDVNGDGYADVIAGAPGFDSGQSNEGAAFVYYGARAQGRPVLPTQYRGDGSTPVERWGNSQSPFDFPVALEATSARGRERVKLELQACPAGSPFGYPLCKSYVGAEWTELGANPQGATLSLTATGLTANVVYHWRARVLYTPLTGVSPHVIPAHGPWRRVQANGDAADIRVGGAPSGNGVFSNSYE